MQTKSFFDFVEKNAFEVRISQMRCVDLNLETVLENSNGKYYFVWVVSGGDLSCSGRKGEPLANVANRWADTILRLKEEGILA